MPTPEQSVLLSILLCLGGAVATVVVRKSKAVAGWVAFGVTALTGVLILSAVAQVLKGGPGHPTQFLQMPALGFALRIYVDGLTSVFLLLAVLVAMPAALYSIPYLQRDREYGAGRYYPYFLLFLAAMYGLLSTTDMMWFFFIFWQLMTLPGYALIRFEHRRPESVRAAKRYLWMMQLACAATMAGAWVLAGAGPATAGDPGLAYDFDTVSAKLPAMLTTRPLAAGAAFGLFLVGFGIKMGMWPFGQLWLPDAHPAAPSPVSAMLSGVMIKTGVYGLVRYFLWLVPVEGRASFPLAGWGAVVALLGTVTLFTGTMQALKQDQTKRLLAFSSIGQVGYVLLGVGACMALLPGSATAESSRALAGIALCGALFHVLNHGVFKGLLFLNAGSVSYATGTQDLNQLGGLMRLMPVTAITALVGSLSISGVPLLNGFASKWLLWVATIQAGTSARYLPVCGAIAVLTSALTLATFMKFFGAGFLGRSSAYVNAQAARPGGLEVGGRMWVPQVWLALLCVVLGSVPALGIRLVLAALDASPQGYGTLLAGASGLQAGVLGGVATGARTALYAPAAFGLALALIILGVRAFSRLGGARRRAAAPWLCGYVEAGESNRYAARGMYGEVKRHFTWLGGAP